MLNRFDFQQPQNSFMYELTLWIKDHEGNPTNKQKSIKTNSPAKLASFWFKHQVPKRKKKSVNINKLPTAEQATKILNQIYSKESNI